ncbi:EamA family transporter [Helicobacter saguini]|uniref:DMT family transporter n=1 Tax=Helicobacter saguini TaxID=1548018 RepID=A0A347VTH6_9HELI|nr:DMT family transporter [Helicobacter saguini]MWV62093.1 EamA family transporter [Helicobacter saguini]MWV67234.1 EamA family transporter [Helicobacter saguini]MWV69588.1 EamA family transporter [Helicobacter saguini]MWV70862.1 EamA family transporter [Helicobacter saguini]TLD94303.1 DMT family transporter [Helicobacter saguini]
MSNITFGVMFMLLSAFCFALMNAFAKALSDDGIPPMESVFFRSLIMVIIVGSMYLYNFSTHKNRKYKKTYKPGGWFSLFLRVVMGGLSFLAVFYNISTIPLGTAAAFAQTMPIYAVILGAIFLKEKLTLPIIFATIIGFVGILLISNPRLNGISLVNVAVGIFSGLSLAIAFVSLRGLGEHFSNMFIIFAFGVGNSILGFCGMFLPISGVGGFVVPAVREWWMIVLMGGFGTLGQVFLNRAYMAAPVGIVAPIDYTRILFSLLFGILLGDALPNLMTFSGIILIIFSGILIALPSLLKDLRKIRKEV